jgi:hypothetical protein
MRVAVIGTGRYPRAAVVAEANRAAAAGHRVIALVSRPDEEHDGGFDPAVEVRHDEHALVRTRASAFCRRAFVKFPIRLLRRLQVPPFRRVFGKAVAEYRRWVSEPIEIRCNRADRALRRRLLTDTLARRVAAWEPDLVVLLNVEAIALADAFLPWMEEHRTGVAYAYAEPVEAR